uniref:Uncharacterized protein n=2 Tax=Sphaerodactylus townsendi TaxID=933632 RepID=A0ACB8EGQ8_9SAUR
MSPEKARKTALELARVMGCTEDEGSAIVNCLQEKPLEELQTYMSSVMDPKIVLNLPFVPTTDGDFIPDDPQKLVESRHFQTKPIMIGTTSDEGSLFIFFSSQVLRASNECLLTWEELLEVLKGSVHNATDDIIHSIAQRYSKAEPEGPEQYRSALSQAWGDYYFVSPANEVATETAKTGSPVYAYTFTHHSVGSVWPEWTGSYHGSEIPYVFGTLTLLPGTNETHTEAELALIPQVMRYWAEFARSGNPTPSDVGEAKWLLYNPAEQNFFRISTEPPQVMKPSPARHCSFWKALLSEASSPDRPPRDSLPSSPEVSRKEEL